MISLKDYKKPLSFALAAALASAALSPPAHAFGGKKPTPEEKKAIEDLETTKTRVRLLRDQIAEIPEFQLELRQTRCQQALEGTRDNLPNVQAQTQGRFAWSIKCQQERKEKWKSQIDPALTQLESKIEEANKNKLGWESPEYREMNRKLVELLDKDYAHYMTVWFTKQLGHLKSWQSKLGDRGLFLYPVWGVLEKGRPLEPTNPRNWFAPTQVDHSCSEIPDYQGAAELAFYNVVQVCEAGCLERDQKILASSGPVRELEAQSIGSGGATSLLTLAPTATLDRPEFTATSVQALIQSGEASPEEMVEITTLNGNHLKVTTSHPMLAADGFMKPAGQLKVGDALLASDGTTTQRDVVAAVVGYTLHDKVFNLRMDSSDPKRNVVVSQGLLTGTSMYQNELRDQMNRGLMRVLLPSSLLR